MAVCISCLKSQRTFYEHFLLLQMLRCWIIYYIVYYVEYKSRHIHKIFEDILLSLYLFDFLLKGLLQIFVSPNELIENLQSKSR